MSYRTAFFAPATVVARNAGWLGALRQMPWDGFDPSTKDRMKFY